MTQAEGLAPEIEGEPPVSRRSLLGLSLGGAAFLATARQATAQPAPPPVFTPGIADLRFLLSRITYGYDAATTARAQTLGYAAFLEEQLHPELIADTTLDAMLAPLTTLAATSQQNYDNYYVHGNGTFITSQLKTAAVLRAAFSKRQLYERMVEFWTDHFSIDQSDSSNNVLKTQDDRDVIRANALGSFPQMLRASARSASMGFYLGNYRNTAASPNENYGREILELHTLGVGNYTEADVKAVARCFTGWGYSIAPGQLGQFEYHASLHDDTWKVVLGHPITAGGGANDGEIVLRLLSAHPATAQFLARKMCRWLLCYAPPQVVVDAVANTYLATNGDIKAMIRVILAPTSVANVSQDQLAKYKRPFHLVTSILRASSFQLSQPEQLPIELGYMGHEPFRWPSPNGYPDTFEDWGSGQLPRWTFVSKLFSNAIPGVVFTPSTVFAGVPKDQLARAANMGLAGGSISIADAYVIQRYADSFPAITDELLRDVMILTASSRSFQLY